MNPPISILRDHPADFCQEHGIEWLPLVGSALREDFGGNKGTLLNYWNNLDWRILNSGNSTAFPNYSVEEEATSPTDPGKRYLFIEG